MIANISKKFFIAAVIFSILSIICGFTTFLLSGTYGDAPFYTVSILKFLVSATFSTLFISLTLRWLGQIFDKTE